MRRDHHAPGIRRAEKNWNRRRDAIVDELMSQDAAGHPLSVACR